MSKNRVILTKTKTIRECENALGVEINLRLIAKFSIG